MDNKRNKKSLNDLRPLDDILKNSVSDYNSPLSLSACEEEKLPLPSMRRCF